MSGPLRRAARTDGNQSDIVAALERAGCDVLDLSAVGKGCPDLLVAAPTHPWKLKLLEVKNPEVPIADQQLTEAQKKFHAKWKGPIYIVKSIDEALAAVGIQRGRS